MSNPEEPDEGGALELAIQTRLIPATPFGQFNDHLRYERRLSERTVESYGDRLFDLRAATGRDFLTDRESDQLGVADLLGFMRERSHLAPATISLTLSAFRAWRRFGCLRGWWFLGPEMLVQAPRWLRAKRPPLTPGQRDTLLGALRTDAEVSLVGYCYGAGCRITETALMRPRHWLDDRLRFPGKGPGGMSKVRDVPLHRFLVENRKTMQRSWAMSTYQRTYEGLRDRLGFHFTPHTLRRTFDTGLRDNGGRGDVVDELMGHSGETVAARHYTWISWDLKVSTMELLPF